MRILIITLLLLLLTSTAVLPNNNSKVTNKTSKLTVQSELQKEMKPLFVKLSKQPPCKNEKETLVKWMDICNAHFGLPPKTVQAVGIVESRSKYEMKKDGLQFQTGPLGRRGTYVGPMGIKHIFKKKWNIYDPYVNVYIGARAMARYGNLKRSMQKYNASFNGAYYYTILRIANQLKNMEIKQPKFPG